MDYIYPLTIIHDRYGGCYSGGAYLAFNSEHIPDISDVYGDDLSCGFFWYTYEQKRKDNPSYYPLVGKGSTIMEAYNDLKRQLK